MKPWIEAREIRYRRIGNERRIPFAFWPDSQECLHRTRLIVSPNFSLFYSCQVWQQDQGGVFILVCTYVLLCFSTVLYIGSIYRKVASSNTSRLEAHAGFFRLLMKGIFDPYRKVVSSNTCRLEAYEAFLDCLWRGFAILMYSNLLP